MFAVMCGNEEAVGVLLAAGADLDIENSDGQRAADIEAEAGTSIIQTVAAQDALRSLHIVAGRSSDK